MIVFISGSSKLKSLDKRMTDCLDEYMAKKASFIEKCQEKSHALAR